MITEQTRGNDMLKCKWLPLYVILFCCFAVPGGIMTTAEAERAPVDWDDMAVGR